MPPRDDTAATLRLFVAVELSHELRDALGNAMELLKRAGANDGLRWVRPEGIHITLKFLGATPAERVHELAAALGTALDGAQPFTLQPDGIGAFFGGRFYGEKQRLSLGREPRHNNLRVLWVGVRGDTDALGALAARVESALAPLGFPTEKRPFYAHLTLARMRDDADAGTRTRVFAAVEPYLSGGVQTGRFNRALVPAFPPLHVDHVVLMRSTLGPGGARYDALATFPFVGTDSAA
jgi:2'-5' RNA ligase